MWQGEADIADAQMWWVRRLINAAAAQLKLLDKAQEGALLEADGKAAETLKLQAQEAKQSEVSAPPCTSQLLVCSA